MSDGPTIYCTEPLQVYLDDAAANKPAPGGGSVSACAGALGAALVSMVCNLTRGREKFAGVEQEIVALVEASEAARGRLEQLLQEDTTAYNGVITAYRMPKDTAAQQAARSTATPPTSAVNDQTSIPSSRRNARATPPAATRAAVSRAEARSRTLRTSLKPYLRAPARSA